MSIHHKKNGGYLQWSMEQTNRQLLAERAARLDNDAWWGVTVILSLLWVAVIIYAIR